MKHITATHIVCWPNCGFYPAVIIGNYMRIVVDAHKERINIKKWQRIPEWVDGLKVTALPVSEHRSWLQFPSDDGEYNYNYSSRWMN